MVLNSVMIFGHESGGNGPAALAFLIIFIIMLLGAIVALSLILIDLLNGNLVAEEDENENAENAEALEEAVPAEDLESYRAGRLTYDKSFLAKYIQSDDSVKEWYGRIKNELMSYERVHDRMSWRRETFKVGRNIVARLAIRGKTLCIFLPLDPKNYENSDYRVEDVSGTAQYAETPCVYRVRSDQRLEYAFELIEDAMHSVGAEKGDAVEQDYYLPYENLSVLIGKGLVKRIVRN